MQMNDEPVVFQMTNTGVLKVCICGEHTDGYMPIKYLEGSKVLLHYIDKDTKEIKAWNGSEQDS